MHVNTEHVLAWKVTSRATFPCPSVVINPIDFKVFHDIVGVYVLVLDPPVFFSDVTLPLYQKFLVGGMWLAPDINDPVDEELFTPFTFALVTKHAILVEE